MTSFAANLVPQIRAILESSDLSKISTKGVRKELIARGHDADEIKQNRASINQEIEAIFDELTGAQEAGSPSSADIPLDVTPHSSLPEPLRKPHIKEEAKPIVKPERASQTTSDSAETDAQLAARLQREFDAEQSRGRASRSGGVSKKKVTKKRKSKATLGSDEEGDAPKKRKGGGGGAFNKEMVLSDALSALVGEARLSRPQTVKRIWEYVKARDLQDPNDKRYILCDDRMKAVFHTDKLHMFTMNKLLVDHVRDPDEIANGGAPVERKPAVVKAEPAAKSEAEVYSSDSDDF